MKTHILEDMTKEWFWAITNYLDEIETSKDEAQIYINSWGGSIWVLECIYTRLEELREKWIKIKLRANFMASSAFELFYRYKWDKVLEVWCDWVVHASATETSIFYNDWETKIRSNDNVERARVKEAEQIFKYDFLTVKEQKEFDDGYDIYLNYKRLQSIFK